MSRTVCQSNFKGWNAQFHPMKLTISSDETHGFILWNSQFQCLKLYGQPYLMNHALISDKRYGELLVDEHCSSEDIPYKFNGKEFDEETGLYYYGARYMNPVTSLWLNVDKLIERCSYRSSYIFCGGKSCKLY